MVVSGSIMVGRTMSLRLFMGWLGGLRTSVRNRGKYHIAVPETVGMMWV